jgi:hypothetical protein
MQENHIQSKQINRIISGYVNIPTYTILDTSGNVNVYTELSSVVNTAAYKGKPLELKQSADETENGIVFSGVNNIVLINLIEGNRKIFEERSEVYGKITYIDATNYEINFFYLDSSGVENSYTFSENTDVSLKIPYRYLLHELPSDIILTLKTLVKGEIEGAINFVPEQTDTWKDSVISIVNDPSSLTPSEGDRYLVGTTPMGSFLSKEDNIAEYNGIAWGFTEPSDSFTIKNKNVDTILYQYNGDYPAGEWITQPFLNHALGLPTSGSWSDGLFDFENTKPVDAISELNKIMRALTPPAAPELNDWNEITMTPKIQGKLSFSTSLPLTGYNPADTPGISNPIGLAGLFEISGKRLGITTLSGTVLSGDLNYNTSESNTMPTPSYVEKSFKDAEKGNVKLFVNDTEVSSIDLESTTSALDSSSGGLTSGISVSAQFPAYFSNGTAFDDIQHRTGSWIIVKTDLSNGYNKIHIVHEIEPGNELVLSEHEVIVDASTIPTSFSGATLTPSSLLGAKYLSGIAYNTSGVLNYSIDINNAYSNTYSPDSDAIQFIGTSCEATEQLLPPNTAGPSQIISLTDKTVTINANILLNASASIRTSVKRTVQTTEASNITSVGNILLDAVMPDSTDLIETFNGETFRLPSNVNFDNYSTFAAAAWDSQFSIKDGEFTGYGDGLQVINGVLCYPGNLFLEDFRTSVILNGPTWNDGGLKGTGRNYSLNTGNKTYYRYFKQTSPSVANFVFNVSGSSINFIAADGTLTSNNCKIELKAPSQTGWLDCFSDFETESFLNGDGCRSATLGLGRALDASWGLTIGTKNTANTGGYVVLKITVGPNFTGSISEINFQFI